MTKLQILTKDEAPIGGFDYVKMDYVPLTQKLQEFSDNECELIIAQNIIDDSEPEALGENLMAITNKLRVNGRIVVGGIDLRMFCKNVTNNVIDESSARDCVSKVKSMMNLASAENIVKSLNLTVVHSKMNGFRYEISAVRS